MEFLGPRDKIYHVCNDVS